MDTSRESIYLSGFSHPDLFSEEYSTYPPSTFPTLNFIEESLTTDPEEWVKGRHILDYFRSKLQESGLPGKREILDYLRHQYRRQCRPSTLKNSFTSLESFMKLLKEQGKGGVEEIDKRDLEAFVEHEQDRGLKLGTVRTRLAAVKAFLRFLMENGVVQESIFPWKLNIRMPETLPRAMDAEDVTRLLAVEGSVRNLAMVLLLLRTGMRIGELLESRVVDVNMKERKILIFEAFKNRKGRVVFFSDDAKKALEAWLKERNRDEVFIFYGQKSRPLTYAAARMVFVKYLQKAGISHKGYSLHSLRHTYATELLNARMPIECLEKLLGHTSLAVTRRYARLTDKTREEEYFKAMAIIEREERDGNLGCDRELQAILEKTQLLPPHGEDIHEHP